MQMYEVRALMDYEYYAHKDGWEQARLVAYLIAQCNSTKQLKDTDIAKFYWEKEEAESDKVTTISNADIERLRAKANQYINNIK